MRIFVSGADGQLAKSLSRLADGPDDLKVLCRGRPDFDLTDTAQAERMVVELKPDAIINAAAYTAVDKAETEPQQAFAINCDGAAAMARAAAALDIPIVQISTDYVFSGKKSSPYVESDDVGPDGVYGQSKLAAELIVRNIAPRHAILRTSWVYSPFGNNFVKTMIRLSSERKVLRVVSDQVGCPTAAIDLADAAMKVCKALIAENTESGIYHVAGSGDTHWAGFAESIFSLIAARGLPVPVVEHISTADYPTAAKRPANSRLSCDKVRDVFGIQLPPWQESLARCISELHLP
jgi:dTDP-4-dehydrorhamnose reductase